jgi:NAD(P)-dependent dehydrogenase (short-subunit alcohol dehydrogenase family)
MAIQSDVTNLRDVQRLYSVVRDVKGHVDIVFASEAEPVTPSYFDGIFNTDVRGVLFAVDGALPLMRDGGSIMIDGTIAEAETGNTNVAAEAQGAIRALARDWTFDLSDRGIRACVTSREDCVSCAAA